MSNILSRQATIGHSLRFNSSAANQSLSRTPSSSSNMKTWTWSGWVKKIIQGTDQTLFAARDAGGNNYVQLFFYSDDTVQFAASVGGVNAGAKISNAKYRDPSQWLHVVGVWDALNSIARIYVNGTEVTYSTNTNPTNQNYAVNNSAYQHMVGALPTTPSNFFDGYMSEVIFVDGLTLTPDYFGYSDPHTGKWSPRPFNGDMGASGFYLPFTDGTSTTTLGYDKAPLRTNHIAYNNWTLNNFTRAAGINECWMLDTPTNNYQTINTIEAGSYLNGASITMGGLKFARPTGNSQTNYMSALRVPSDKWYFEMHSVTLTDSGSLNVGITQGGSTYAQLQLQSGTSLTATSGSGAQSGLAAALNTDVFGVLADLSNGTVQFYKNNVAFGTQITGLIDSGAPWVISGSIAWLGGLVLNFGQRDFLYTPPSGYKAMCQANLPLNGLRHPERWMDVVTYTGNGSTQFVPTSVKYPDFVWAKSRFDGATHITGNHALFDTQRGPTRYLTSNATASESLVQVKLDSFDAGGFTIANNGAFEQQINYNGDPCVAWVWKAGGTPVVNNSGTLQSMVSANVEAGFSIVTWSGSATADQSVGHGLGRPVDFAILKARNSAQNWIVWHRSVTTGNGKYLYLNTNDLLQGPSGTPVWDSTNLSTQASATTFTVGANLAVNNNTSPGMVMYAWAEIPGFSKFGSYIGNGVADGPYVYCGFRPKFLMIKRVTGGTGFWTMMDTTRGNYNPVGVSSGSALLLSADSSGSEISGTYTHDILYNGFKIRCDLTAASLNYTSDTYVFAAFAEYPLSDALAR